jgi:hypothetical protein
MENLNPSLFDWDFQMFNNNSIDLDGRGTINGPVDSTIPMDNHPNSIQQNEQQNYG